MGNFFNYMKDEDTDNQFLTTLETML